MSNTDKVKQVPVPAFHEIFGDDTIKVRSCVLLFESVSDIPVLKAIKSKYRW